MVPLMPGRASQTVTRHSAAPYRLNISLSCGGAALCFMSTHWGHWHPLVELVRAYYTSCVIGRFSSFVFPWIVCIAFLAWGCRVRNPFRELPATGDALEVIWGIEWYHDALFVTHTSPLFNPLIFYPNGWHTATLAHTPALFLLAQPIRFLGGPAFAYNALAIISFLICFAGCLRLVRLFNSSLAIVTVSAAVFTFVNFRWFRIGGHQHILWASSFLPWFLWGLETLRRAQSRLQARTYAILSGLIWGAMISFSLYSVFLGAVGFAIWGRQLFTWRRFKQAGTIAAVALIVGAPTMVLYTIGSRADAMTNFSGRELVSWSASLNSLAIPSLFHPIPAVRHLAAAVYRGPKDESGQTNLGIVTFILGLAGAGCVIRSQRKQSNLVFLAAVGLTLALGQFVRWNGSVVSVPFLRPFDEVFWKAAHFFKPNVFDSAAPPAEFKTGIPLPGYLVSIFIPFSDAGRVASRYAFVGGLGLIMLAGIALQRLRKTCRYVVLAVWLVEVLPRPTERVVLPTGGHPAHQWLARQRLSSSEGILDMDQHFVMMGPEIAFATLFDRTATAAGLGSFWPQHTKALLNYFARSQGSVSRPDLVLVLQQYRIRYLLVHLRGDRELELWNELTKNPSLRPVQCFESQNNLLWTYPMCVAEVMPGRG